MTSVASVRNVRPGLLGAQRPRILHVPDFASSTGDEAVKLAAMAGLVLDPWQRFVMVNALGEREDGKWAAREVGVEVPRQNGKGGLLEARELAGLFLLGERLIIHSAHEFATAEQALERMAALLEGSPTLWRHVDRVKRSHGQEGIYLTDGRSLRYKTRTKGGGRGFTADCVILDEAMHIPEAMHGALFPTLRAIPNPQVWYTGSAVDQESMENGVVFARVRERAVSGDGTGLAYFGWSPPFDKPGDIPDSALDDPEVWAQANPALGIRIDADYMAQERESMDTRTFAVELLGVGDWPRVTGADGAVISIKSWLSLVDPASTPTDPLMFAFDVAPDRLSAAVTAAGWRDDGLAHVEVMEHKRGTPGWVVEYLAERVERHQPAGVFCDERSPAASLVTALENAGVRVTVLKSTDQAKACGAFFDAVDQRTIRHLGTNELVNALRGAVQRPLGDAWGWSRKNSTVDITPLVAGTIATWALLERAGTGGEFMSFSPEDLEAAFQ
jgi:hypothetical protein